MGAMTRHCRSMIALAFIFAAISFAQPFSAYAQTLTRLAPSPELTAISNRIEEFRANLAQHFGIKDIFVGGGSSRAILDHLYDGKPLEMRDLDIFVVAGREVTEDWARSIGQKLESPTLGKFSDKDLRPRPRGNPALPLPQRHRYNAGFGFFWLGGTPDIFDISIFHQVTDLQLNGIFDIDTVMIPVRGSFIEGLRQSLVGKDYATVVREGGVLDRFQGYSAWRKQNLTIIHWDEIDRDPVLNGIRVARTMAKVGKQSLSRADEAHIKTSIAQATNTNRLQIVRNLLKLLDDKTAPEQIQILLRWGVFKMIDQSLDQALAKVKVETLREAFALQASSLGRLSELIKSAPIHARLRFLVDVTLVEPEWALRQIAGLLVESIANTRWSVTPIDPEALRTVLATALAQKAYAKQLQGYWQNPQMSADLAAWLSLRAALQITTANGGTDQATSDPAAWREAVARLYPLAKLSEQVELTKKLSAPRVGYFTGVLNPFHTGHQQLLVTAIESLGLDQIYVIPTVKTKHNETPIGWHDRQEMIRLGTQEIPKVKTLSSDYYSLLQQGTGPTLQRLFGTLAPGTQLVHVMGADSFERFLEAGYLEKHAREGHEVAVIARAGYAMPALKPEQSRQISFLQTNSMVVYSEQARSSTLIRQTLAKGESIGGMVPPLVEKYILSRGLYVDQPVPLVAQEINYREYGSRSAPALVLVHGMDSSLATFDSVVHHLAEHFRVIVYDQRGHGNTAIRGEDYSTNTMALDLRALLDHLQLQSVFLLGHSMGARTATRFAALYPERVKALIIEDMELLARSRETNEQIVKRARIAADLPVEFASGEALLQTLAPTFGNLKAQSILQNQTTRRADGTLRLSFDPKVSVLYRGQASREDFTQELGRLKMPILILQANPKTSAISAEGLGHLRQHLPDAQLFTIPGANHYIHQSAPTQFLNTVVPFLHRALLPPALTCRGVVAG